MTELLSVRVRIRLPSRSNEQHGQGKRRRGGKLGAKMGLVAEQRRATLAALGYRCSRCGESGQTLPRVLSPVCSCSTPFRLADPRPRPVIAGPEHPLDVLLVRIPSAPRGKLVDKTNLWQCLKTVQDAFVEQLWAWNKLPGRPDDSVGWLRFCCEQTTEGRIRGTEQCLVVVAEREDIMAPTPAVLVRWREGAL